jgi:ArsR family metal-binding transcriptional regulator
MIDPVDVYDKLPRKDCGKCTTGTCMAFAVHFLRRVISLSECVELDEKSKEEISAMLTDQDNG